MKGTGLLLGCASPPVCDALYGPFKRKFAKGPCASCVLHITVRACFDRNISNPALRPCARRRLTGSSS